MTFCVGVIHQNSVYLTADSAVTYPGLGLAALLPGGTTSFGEAPVDESDKSVREAALKIVGLGHNAAVALAGDIDRAVEAIGLLRTVYGDQAIPDLLRTIGNSMDLTLPDHFHLLIGRVSTAGPELWRWKSSAPNAPERIDRYASIGKLETWHPVMVETIAHRLGNLQEDRVLPVLLAVQQSWTMKEMLLSHGVGGIFAGLRITEAAVEWMDDTNYVVFAPAAKSGFITAIARGGGVSISSSLRPNTHTYITSLDVPNGDKAWLDKWNPDIAKSMDECAARHWIVMDAAVGNVAIIDALVRTTDTSIIKLTNLGGGQYDLALHELLVAYLSQPAPPGAAGGGRFKFLPEPDALKALGNSFSAPPPTPR